MVALWVSVEDLGATMSGDSFCELADRRVVYVWGIRQDNDPARLSMSSADACVPADISYTTYALPGLEGLTLDGSNRLQHGSSTSTPHMPAAILQSPAMVGYGAWGASVAAFLFSGAFLAVVLLVYAD